MAAPPRHVSMLSISNSNAGTPQSASSDKPQTPQPPSTPQQASGLRVPSNRKTIYDRHLNRSRNAELSRASFAYLFAEMVTYAQRRVTGIQDLEKRIPSWSSPSRPSILSIYLYLLLCSLQLIDIIIPTKPSSPDPPPPPSHPRPTMETPLPALRRCPRTFLNTYISVPREMNMLNCAAYIAGVIEGVCDGCGFEAKVSAHNQPTEMWPSRTVFLLRFGDSVMEREKVLERAGIK
ncbi:hypothetical protein N7509_002676 [Penicillium cosmopolitanum]|uniref:Trafficking protein particle complex subunit n=1 Tax=Penicillium cosmopolitanum TaxID=1131564 RepID=A0A9X0BDJ7_9EURO|nr:uncharacterized protein N7509_002676 [Penicillium cosmopolitanum]KAJ5408793.1 hypothetical protein N7509_002676 [Penicillium cosmopolitanum]